MGSHSRAQSHVYFGRTKSSPSVEGPRIVASTSSPVWYRLYSSSRADARRESVMVGNRGPVVEGHQFLAFCFINLPTVTHYIPSFPQSFCLKLRL